MGRVVTIHAVVDDPDGRTVELTEERWSHITERHPEISAFDDAILRAVQSPDSRTPGREANEEWYYLKTDCP